MFDKTTMFVNMYDGLGRPFGAIQISDSAVISPHVAAAETALSSASRLTEFLATEPG
jgi:uncharacterized protein DUF6879